MKRIITLFTLISTCFIVIASPTDPTPQKVVQPNGDTISISFRGDEYGSWCEDMNGNIIDLNNDKYWVYVTIQNDQKVLTNQIVTSTSTPININRDSVLNFIIQKRQESYQQRNSTNGISSRASNGNALLPSTGQQKILTVLVQFTDVKFQNQSGVRQEIQRMMNQVDYVHPGQSYITGSVRDYYLQASYNQLDIESTVLGPYTISRSMAYYGANIDNSIDTRVHELVEAVMTMLANNIDLAPYDNNNDGWIDCIHILYAGKGENENTSTLKNTIWPHKGSLTDPVSGNGKKMKNYIITPEIKGNYYCGIGTICHELCHAMGVPDFYDTNYDIDGEFLGTGNWDLMASGSLNSYHPLFAGINPAHPNPYIKTRMLGWTSATELSGDNRLYTLSSSESDASSIYKISTSTPNEYYLLENRQGKKLPGTGLVIYHVSSDIEDYVESNTINVAHPQKLYVVAANTHNKKPTDFLGAYGNINSATATFKDDVANNIFFTSQTFPSNCDWAENTTTNKDVCFIKEVANNGEKQITFVLNPKISGPDVLCDSAIYSLPHVPDSATITWSYIRPTNISSACTPLYIGTGQGTKNICFKRGGEVKIEHPGPELEEPDTSWIPMPVSSTPVFTFIPYKGFITIKANVTFNNETYTVTKKIYMPEKVEIDDQGMGFGNPWMAGVTKAISLESPLNSEIVGDILWEVDMVGGSSFTRQGGISVVLTPTNSVTTISITATYLKGCGDDNQTCTKVFPVQRNNTLSFTNPASGNVEINVWDGGVSDSNMRSFNSPEPCMGAYRLELWHDLYGKVREIDVAENTPTVTMNLDGLSSGVYVLRLIIDNQIITAEQLIVK